MEVKVTSFTAETKAEAFWRKKYSKRKEKHMLKVEHNCHLISWRGEIWVVKVYVQTHAGK